MFIYMCFVFFFKQKTAYEMRIRDWSSDVCSSDLLERHLRPEQAILGLRKELGLFANLRPAKLFPELADASALRPEIARAIDLVIIRELTGDVYFGQPRGLRKTDKGLREGFDTMRYDESEIDRKSTRLNSSH